MKITLAKACSDLGVHICGSEKGPTSLEEIDKYVNNIVIVNKDNVPKELEQGNKLRNFKYVNNGESLSVMAELVNAGVSVLRLVELMNNKPRKAVLVEAAAAANAEFYYRNRLAVAIINRRDYRDMDGRGEMILNILGQIKGVEYVVLLKEQKETQIGVSIRSRSRAIDKIAASFGGGGHERAAGAIVRGDTLENVRAKIIEAFKGM